MNARGLTIVVGVGLVATGCGGAVATLHGGQATSTQTARAGTALSAVTAASTPTPTAVATPVPVAVPTATPAPASAPTSPAGQAIVVAGDGTTSNPSFEVAIVSSRGGTIASTRVAQDARWTIGTGPTAAYWVTAGTLQRLDEHGTVTTLATVPTTESGRVVVSPDGAQWAYATTEQTTPSTVTNRIYRGSAGHSAQLVAERTADANNPSPDTPPQWQYYLMSWTARGILVERQPVGGCGCGTPFDMQMSASSAAFIDPASGVATPLSATAACPVSGVSDGGTLACFHVSSTGASDALRLSDGAQVTHTYALSGANDAGDATFDGSTLAYATVPSGAGGCGGPDWQPQTTLHVMDVRTGDARGVGQHGLAPVAWLPDGSILATLSVAADSGTSRTVVDVDPASGAVVRTILGHGFDVVGLA